MEVPHLSRSAVLHNYPMDNKKLPSTFK